MSIIDEIKEKLKKYPNLEIDEGENYIFISAPEETGFTLGFEIVENEPTVHYGSSHEHFINEKEALNKFALGFSNRARFAVYSRGGVEYAFVMETKKGDRWVSGGVGCIPLFPFWRKKEVTYRQNNLFDIDDDQMDNAFDLL